MDHLIQRFIQGRRGRLGVIQTQSMPLPARQLLIQRLTERWSLPERLIARYGRGLRQPGAVPRFQVNRVEAIAPGESPETLWLSLQAKLPGLSRTSSQEEIPSFAQKHTIPQPDQNLALGKSISSEKVEESALDSSREIHSKSEILQKSEHFFSSKSTVENSDLHAESETFRVRRISPRLADATGTNVGSDFANEFTSQLSLETSSLPLNNILTDTDSSLKPIEIYPNRSLASPSMELGHPLSVSLKSNPPLYTAPHPPNTGGLKTTQSPPVYVLAHASRRGDLGSERNASVLLKPLPKVAAKPNNNVLLQLSRKQENSAMTATTPALPLAKLLAQSSSAESTPLPLALPKRQQAIEQRDRPMEIETAADRQNTMHPVSREQPISPVAPSMSPINIQNITEQVSRQIFRQFRLERERRGMHP